MAIAKQQLDPDRDPVDLFHVAVRKYGIDAHSPWWRKVFFRAVYLPFVRFAFKRMSIPAPSRILENGDFEWLEGIGIATDMEVAKGMCKGEFYRIAALPMNCGLPKESVQYKGHDYPQSIIPDRYRRRTFPLTAKPCAEVAAEQKGVEALIAKVDNMREKLRTSAAI